MESFEQKASFLTFFSTNERIGRKNSNKESFLIYKITKNRGSGYR